MKINSNSSPLPNPLPLRRARGISPSFFLIVAMFLVPVAMWIQLHAPTLWSQRLLFTNINNEPDLHTPQFSSGYLLPPVINHDLSIGPEKSPVILTGRVRVMPNATLTLEPGVKIFANEFASLNVDGRLVSIGTDKKNIEYSTNEQHPSNQNWAGIIVNGRADFAYSTIHNASPGISCLGVSNVSINTTHIADGSTGVFATSPTCTIAKSRIVGRRVGVEAIGVDPKISDTNITAGQKQIEFVQ